MGKGEKRGGRARAGGRRVHHHQHRRHRPQGSYLYRTIGMARGSRTGHYVFGIWLFVFASFLTVTGIALTVVFSTNFNSYYHLIMVAAGGVLMALAVFMCASAKRKAAAATNSTAAEAVTTVERDSGTHQTAGTSLQPTETPASDATPHGDTMPGQPMDTSGISHPRYFSM
uniref:Uncharacterized protein n=1 Tax=Branchiostoma floridae TaxID=7739 RepID=C3YWK5_BRAFL|eukprot:XP_002599237.1 hypothetical protein BRAFLDRAFT_64413 [Branchiostoma floridae]